MLLTRVECVLCHPGAIASEVVQGSVLGPLVFIVCINSIYDCFTSAKPFLYADDLKVVHCCRSHECNDLMNDIRLQLNSLAFWCAKSCLEFNIEKCGWTRIGNSELDVGKALYPSRHLSLNDFYTNRKQSNPSASVQIRTISTRGNGVSSLPQKYHHLYVSKQRQEIP